MREKEGGGLEVRRHTGCQPLCCRCVWPSWKVNRHQPRLRPMWHDTLPTAVTRVWCAGLSRFMNSGPWEGSFTFCCVGHHIEWQHKEDPIYYIPNFCPLLIRHAHTHTHIHTQRHATNIHTHAPHMHHTALCIWSAPLHSRNALSPFINKKWVPFWSVAVSCQIWTDIIIPENNTSSSHLLTYTPTHSGSLCAYGSAARGPPVPEGVLLMCNPNGLYPVAENALHPRAPVILCSLLSFPTACTLAEKVGEVCVCVFFFPAFPADTE